MQQKKENTLKYSTTQTKTRQYFLMHHTTVPCAITAILRMLQSSEVLYDERVSCSTMELMGTKGKGRDATLLHATKTFPWSLLIENPFTINVVSAKDAAVTANKDNRYIIESRYILFFVCLINRKATSE
jgi:hypothetical protein